MSDKMTCPTCDARTSSVWNAAWEGEPCPHCGGELETPMTQTEEDLAGALATIQRVRDLHVREIHVNRKGEHPYCDHCTHDDDWELTGYPCATIRALDDPQEQP